MSKHGNRVKKVLNTFKIKQYFTRNNLSKNFVSDTIFSIFA